jgi:CRP-like cAMP-binding protein
MTSLTEMLGASAWANGLTREQLLRVESEVSERTIAAAGFVCRRGEPVEHWFGVIDGLLKMGSDSASGKTASYTGIPPGGWFGEGSILKSEARKYDIVALRDSRVACMPRRTFHWLLGESIAFNRFLLNQLNERLGQFIGLLESQRLLDPDARVANCLAWLFHPLLYPGVGLQLKISQEELGFLCGVSRQRVNQALKTLAAKKLLSVHYGRITVIDLPGLRQHGA